MNKLKDKISIWETNIRPGEMDIFFNGYFAGKIKKGSFLSQIYPDRVCSVRLKELNEMLYQSDSDYIFDSSKIEKAFGIVPASYEEGIRATVESYRKL